MVWKELKLTKKDETEFKRKFKKKARFLLDENLDPTLAEGMRGLGWKVKSVEDIGLNGHSDEDILAYAQRENLILITNDRDFLNERRFPPYQNPGVVIIPQNYTHAVNALLGILPIVGEYREQWRGAIVEVSSDVTISIRSTKFDGRRTTTRYRYSNGPYALEWEEEQSGEA